MVYYIGIVLVTLLIIGFQIQNLFSFIIENIFQKNTSLTSRTIIWDSALQSIGEHLLFGHGMLSGDAAKTLLWGQSATHAHNLMLDLLFSYGIFGVILFYWQFAPLDMQLRKYRSSRLSYIMKAFAISYCLLMITDFYIHIPVIYCFYFIAGNMLRLHDKTVHTQSNALLRSSSPGQ